MRSVLLAIFLSCAAPAFAQTAYFSAIEDLPLPPGFSESAPPGLFESPEGRLIAVSAEGAGEGLVVRDFYYAALPSLGWTVSPREDGVLMFQRGRERLTFTVERVGARTLLGAQVLVLSDPAD
jgi:hypothetical protein